MRVGGHVVEFGNQYASRKVGRGPPAAFLAPAYNFTGHHPQPTIHWLRSNFDFALAGVEQAEQFADVIVGQSNAAE